MDAARYKKHYQKVTADASKSDAAAEEAFAYGRMLWQRLVDAYIMPNGPREVNLPSNVRDDLLQLPNYHTPPHPSVLDPAVKIVYELMDESVLVPFLNSVSTQSAVSGVSPWTSVENVDRSKSNSERSTSPSKTRRRRRDYSPHSRMSHPINLSASFTKAGAASHRLSQLVSASWSVGSPSPSHDHSDHDLSASLTDDSTDSASPSASGFDPITPPTTPPMTDLSASTTSDTSPGSSPKLGRGEGWKKMGAKLGWRKSRSGTNISRQVVVREESGTSDDDNMV